MSRKFRQLQSWTEACVFLYRHYDHLYFAQYFYKMKQNETSLVWFDLSLKKIKKNTELDLSFFAQTYNK